jgi:tRNA (pseudouridine54-N1)-methyltransferase
MRHFIYFSKEGPTSGKALSQGNLMKAGRVDIAIHSLIQGIFLSHDFRQDCVFHLVFYGMPDPPKHLEISVKEDTPISKKNIATLVQKLLYKFQEGIKKEVFPGCFVEKKSFLKLIEELQEQDCEIFILEKRGEPLREVKIEKTPVFIVGDHNGLPKKELKRLKQLVKTISIGPKMYFASQTVAVVNNELDLRGI